MNILGVIPARYASTRFPGKPLVQINGKSMIQRVYEQSTKSLKHVVVATDDMRILNHVENFGGKVVMTSDNHLNGTSRCFEALNIYSSKIAEKFDIVVNIQGDEPFINPLAITELISLFSAFDTEIATLVNSQKYSEELLNPNRIKAVIDINGKGIYFSRSLIPYVRNVENIDKITFYSHIGIYAFRVEILEKICKLSPSMIEIAESLEQNKWIENGFCIKTKITDYKSFSIDSPEDLKNIPNIAENQ